jgi:hypothetical protein
MREEIVDNFDDLVTVVESHFLSRITSSRYWHFDMQE